MTTNQRAVLQSLLYCSLLTFDVYKVAVLGIFFTWALKVVFLSLARATKR